MNSKKVCTLIGIAMLATGLSLSAKAQNYTYASLLDFNNTNGSSPYAGLYLDGSGNLYGTATYGARGFGNVFKISSTGQFTDLFDFTFSNNGAYPRAALIMDSSGNLYGTASGGATGYGSVFKISATGQYTNLLSFNGTNGANPYAALTLDSTTGTLYGTTYGGGTNGAGTLFKISTTGQYTKLLDFNNTNGANPYASLTFDSNTGNLYGTTYGGGANGAGTVFRLTSTGQYTTLLDFNTSNGADPYGGLVIDRFGNLYGSTSGGGANYKGLVFKISSTGLYSDLLDFNGTNGSSPNAGLAIDSAGNLYGTTLTGGSNNQGTVFSISSSGQYTKLLDFNGTNGASPHSTLVVDGSGNLYGTTTAGGTSSLGKVFTLRNNNVTVPEPGTCTMIVTFVLMGAGFRARRRNR